MYRIAICLFCIFTVNALYINEPATLKGDVITYNFRYWGKQEFNLTEVRLVLSNTDLCSPVTDNFDGNIVFVDTGLCSDETKAANAESANASAILIIYYKDPADGSYAAGAFSGENKKIGIPALTGSVKIDQLNAVRDALNNNETIIISVTNNVSPFMEPGVIAIRILLQIFLGLFVVYLLYFVVLHLRILIKIEGWQFNIKQSVLILNGLAIIVWLIQIFDPLQQNGLFPNAMVFILYVAYLPFQLTAILLVCFYWLEILYTMKYSNTLRKYKWLFFIISFIVTIICFFGGMSFGFYFTFANDLVSVITIPITLIILLCSLAFIIIGRRVKNSLANTNVKTKINEFITMCGLAGVCATIASFLFQVVTNVTWPYLLIIQYHLQLLSLYFSTYYQVKAVSVKEQKQNDIETTTVVKAEIKENITQKEVATI